MITRSLSDLREVLLDLGLSQGNEVLIHADLRLLFKVPGGVEGIIETLQDIVGSNGLLVTPSFTFSFPNQKFDIRKSVSNVGGLTTLFSRRLDVARVPDGMTSYYMLGSKSAELIDNWDHSSYGASSVIGQMAARGGKVLQLGTDILSPIHYVEQLVGVPYRELKRFEGLISDGDTTFTSHTDFYCRTKEVKKIIPDPIRAAYYSSAIEQSYFNTRTCRCFSLDHFIAFARPRLAETPNALIES
jgi:aminoglycoside 3-N-acetyltransferase